MRILYADAVDVRSTASIVEAGHSIDARPELTSETLVEAIEGYEVLVVRSTKVTAEAIASSDALGLIVRAGAGTDNIDRDAASARGIYVCNVPGRNAIAVAELTLGLILALDRRIPDNTADLRDGQWDKKSYTKADGVYGKQIGIIGVGDIGLAVAQRAKAFGMTVVAQRKADRSAATLSAIRSVGIRLLDSLDEVIMTSDVVSLHVPKAEETATMVNRSFLDKMKDGGYLINTARGDLVDEDALLEALDTGRVRAGLDVWNHEPGSGQDRFESPLARHPGVVGTHHIGASTQQAQRSIADGTLEAIEAYLAGSPVNCVNIVSQPSGKACLTIRHLDRVGVLAQVFGVLRSNGLNVQQMQNLVFEGGYAAVASIYVSDDVDNSAVEALTEIDEVLNITVIPSTVEAPSR